MTTFRIYFLDGEYVDVPGVNFTCAIVAAAFARMKAGATTHCELTADEKRCHVVEGAK